jgi:leucyl aminopeptidase
LSPVTATVGCSTSDVEVVAGTLTGFSWLDGDAVAAADLLAVAVGAGPGSVGAVGTPAAESAATRYGLDLAAAIGAERVRGRAGEVVRLSVRAPDGLPARLLLVGTGDAGPGDLRRAAAGLARSARGHTRLATTLGDGGGSDGAQAVVEGLVLGGYAAPASGTKARGDALPVGRVSLIGDHDAGRVARGLLHAGATVRVRDLAETPSNLKNPAWIAAQAADVAAQVGLDVQVWDEQRLAREGFGGVLAVGRGSASPPRFVRLEHAPRGARRDRPVVLVGKGITFDTGGLSIKPREAMVPMKTDMSGAAVVLATLAACRRLGVHRRVIGLLPLAENAVGGSSYRPGDVVRTAGGRTVEIANTDAEGRMVLADALAYADAVLDPEAVVDIATLTGAASVGLGRRHAALYATDERLAAGLERAARRSGERVWRMPLVEDYRPAIDSTVADLRQIPSDRAVGGGSITAALFLREFTGGRRWAHLDVAGPARADKDEHEVTRGATGFGARLLLTWLESLR